MIKIFAADVSGIDPNNPKYAGMISPERYDKVRNYLRNKDKALSIGASLLLGRAAAEMGIATPPLLLTGENGKPYFQNSDIKFNISHSGSAAVCAVCDSEIGVDIEKVRSVDIRIAGRFFFGGEFRDISDAKDPTKRFYDYWVLKESYMKFTGKGFALPLNSFHIVFEKDGICVYEKEQKMPCRFFETTVFSEYRLGLCTENPENEPPEISYVFLD